MNMRKCLYCMDLKKSKELKNPESFERHKCVFKKIFNELTIKEKKKIDNVYDANSKEIGVLRTKIVILEDNIKNIKEDLKHIEELKANKNIYEENCKLMEVIANLRMDLNK